MSKCNWLLSYISDSIIFKACLVLFSWSFVAELLLFFTVYVWVKHNRSGARFVIKQKTSASSLVFDPTRVTQISWTPRFVCFFNKNVIVDGKVCDFMFFSFLQSVFTGSFCLKFMCVCLCKSFDGSWSRFLCCSEQSTWRVVTWFWWLMVSVCLCCSELLTLCFLYKECVCLCKSFCIWTRNLFYVV